MDEKAKEREQERKSNNFEPIFTELLTGESTMLTPYLAYGNSTMQVNTTNPTEVWGAGKRVA